MKQRNARCSFCRKNYQEVGALVEGPEEVYICGDCVKLCDSIIDQERRRRDRSDQPGSGEPGAAAVRARLDQLVSGQEEAKDALIRAAELRQESPGQVLLLGPSRA